MVNLIWFCKFITMDGDGWSLVTSVVPLRALNDEAHLKHYSRNQHGTSVSTVLQTKREIKISWEYWCLDVVTLDLYGPTNISAEVTMEILTISMGTVSL